MGNRITLAPVGSFENHGHLPSNTDTLIAQAFCVLSAERLAATIAPAIEHGYCPTTFMLPDTDSLRFEEVFDRVTAVLRQLVPCITPFQ